MSRLERRASSTRQKFRQQGCGLSEEWVVQCVEHLDASGVSAHNFDDAVYREVLRCDLRQASTTVGLCARVRVMYARARAFVV